MRVGGKRTKPLSIEVLCDWAERAQPNGRAFQKGRIWQTSHQITSTDNEIVYDRL